MERGEGRGWGGVSEEGKTGGEELERSWTEGRGEDGRGGGRGEDGEE